MKASNLTIRDRSLIKGRGKRWGPNHIYPYNKDGRKRFSHAEDVFLNLISSEISLEIIC